MCHDSEFAERCPVRFRRNNAPAKNTQILKLTLQWCWPCRRVWWKRDTRLPLSHSQRIRWLACRQTWQALAFSILRISASRTIWQSAWRRRTGPGPVQFVNLFFYKSYSVIALLYFYTIGTVRWFVDALLAVFVLECRVHPQNQHSSDYMVWNYTCTEHLIWGCRRYLSILRTLDRNLHNRR